MPSFTTTHGIKICISGGDLSLYVVAFDLDIANNFMTITARDDSDNLIAKLFQSVDSATMIHLSVTFYRATPIRCHEISNLDVSSLRYISEAESRSNFWQLALTFAECETTYFD